MNRTVRSRVRVAEPAGGCRFGAATGVQPAPQPAVNRMRRSNAGRARSTLRVGMWTLWRDREVVLTPAGPTEHNRVAELRAMRRGALHARRRRIRAEGDARDV